MELTRVGLAALAVLIWFMLWRAGQRRLGIPPAAGQPLRMGLFPLAVESLLLALFAALWYGSLGFGGTTVLFLCLGALMEVPPRLRTQPLAALPWMAVAAGVVRVVSAGWLMRLVMS
jgi:hypothetical protein